MGVGAGVLIATDAGVAVGDAERWHWLRRKATPKRQIMSNGGRPATLNVKWRLPRVALEGSR